MLDTRTVALITSCINKFGKGQHPEASAANINFFAQDYINQCVEKALKSGRLSNLGITEARKYLGK